MQLSQICLQKFSVSGEPCLLLPTKKVAEHCRSFVLSCSSSPPPPVRLIEYIICPKDKPNATLKTSCCSELHVVLFPEDSFTLARQFWQHTGLACPLNLQNTACLCFLMSLVVQQRLYHRVFRGLQKVEIDIIWTNHFQMVAPLLTQLSQPKSHLPLPKL